MSSNTSSNTSGRARSCTGCRQVKLACDARHTAPKPCSRCTSKGLQCKFDSKFKRIRMRKVTEAFTNKQHDLIPRETPLTTTSSLSPSSVTTETRVNQQFSEIPTVVSDSGPHVRPAFSSFDGIRQWLHIVEGDYYRNYRLMNVEINAETAKTLLRHFQRYYLPHAPFLAPIDSLSTLIDKSPLLFWTLILIATREHATYQGLYEQISIEHAVQISQIDTHFIEEVHALLLLCLWPPPPAQCEKYDPAWNYIGLATNAAMSLNCHRPLFANSSSNTWRDLGSQMVVNPSSEILALTWIYCFHIGARLSASQGYPPPLATELQLRSVVKAVAAVNSSLTNEQKTVTQILRLFCSATSEVECAENLQTRFSFITFFDGEFNSIHQSNISLWTMELDIELLASKLYLYGLILTICNNTSEASDQQAISQPVILLRARDAALKLIARMTQLSTTSVDDSAAYLEGALTFYPKHYFTSLHMAAVFLFRYLASYPGVTQQETVVAIHGLIDAHKIFQSFTDRWDAAQAAMNIETLVNIIRNTDSQSLPLSNLAISDRLGASVVFDGLLRADCYRNRNSVPSVSPSVSTWVTMSEDSRQFLSVTPELTVTKSETSSINLDGKIDNIKNQSHNLLSTFEVWDGHMSNFGVGDLGMGDLLRQMHSWAQ